MSLSALAVVIPARDEEDLLPACLASVAVAVAALSTAAPQVRSRVFVVLDSCRDDSATIVARHRAVTAVPVHLGNVGAARAAGVEAAAAWARSDGAHLWIACTDADSEVPSHWLVGQLELASEGHDLVVGTVQPRPADLTDSELREWRSRHCLDDGHHHVHGANLGFSLDAYRSVGGFPPLLVHEDVELVAAMRNAGIAHVATGRMPVTTSGRHTGRAPAGFAAFLDGLGA